MIRAPIHRLHMNIRLRATRKPIKKVSQQLALKVSNQPHLHFVINYIGHATAQIHCSNRQRLIHRHYKISSSHNALLITQGLTKRLAQRNANILDSVVLIDVKVTNALQRQIESAMPSKQFEHMIEKSNPRRYLVNTLSIYD